MRDESAIPVLLVAEEQSGFSLVEILVSIVILAIITMGVTSSMVGALKFSKFTEANHIASSLAISKMEELAAYAASDLGPSMNETENSVTWPGTNFTFTRTTTIVINSDKSRTATVQVASNNSSLPTQTDFSTTFAVWE